MSLRPSLASPSLDGTDPGVQLLVGQAFLVHACDLRERHAVAAVLVAKIVGLTNRAMGTMLFAALRR
jgi:hypothetical protein